MKNSVNQVRTCLTGWAHGRWQNAHNMKTVPRLLARRLHPKMIGISHSFPRRLSGRPQWGDCRRPTAPTRRVWSASRPTWALRCGQRCQGAPRGRCVMRRVRAVVRPVRVLVAAALAVPLLALLAPTNAGAGTPLTYVSLGDSYTAGPLVPNQIWSPASAIGCIRSDGNYPNLAATERGLSLTDMSCSGAETGDMTNPQGVTPGPNPPQLSALTSTTNVVSLEIGGNDIGFSDIITNCVSWNPFAGDPCTQMYDPNGNDQLLASIQATAPKIAAVLADIHQMAPHAR